MTINTQLTANEATSTTTEQAAPAPRAQVWPLAPLQAGLLYHAVSGEGGLDVYSMQSTYAFGPGLDLDVLERACASLLARHDALRAGFSAALLDRPVQFVPHALATPWRVVDLSGHDRQQALAVLEQIQVSERQRRFDMDAPPLIRFVAVDLGTAGVRLVMTNHHIVIDGWSDALLVVELLHHIAAGGRDESLPRAPQFRDYLAWLGRREPGPDQDAWRRALSGLESGATLADSDPDREAVFPDVAEIDLGPELTAAVGRLARACAVSTNTVYSTLWGLLLRGLLGRDDVVFGTTVSGRPADLPGVDAMVGLFLNTVPQRVRVAPGESVADLLRRVQGEQADLVEHHHVGLGAIQQDAGLGPLFDTLYVMRNTPTDDESFARLSESVGLADIDGGDATHYPATFIVHPGDATRLILSHRTEVIDTDAARALLASGVRLLEAMTADPRRPVGSLAILTPETEAQLVESWTGDALDVPQTSLVDLLRATAASVPERTALVDETGSMTFADLWEAVTAQAAALVQDGVEPGDLVTIELPRGNDVVVAIFAVFAARAAYVPIDAGLPDARRAALREASGARYAITGDAPVTRLAPPIDRPRVEPGGYGHDDLAYVMFTSGSTGAPKGVAIDHVGLVNMLSNHRRRIFEPAGASPAVPWRVAHAVSFAFDMSWEELLWLLDGHEVHLLSEEVRRDPASMTDYLATHRIDVINVTPSVAGALLAGGLLDAQTPTPRLVLLGGEAVGPDVWSALRDAPNTHGYNLYGPTEYTINTLGGGTQESATPIVGRAIDNTDVRVLDSALRPVLDGVPGELYVTGAGLARGYHGSPRLTAERFVADPFGPPGSRMYRTGDIVSRRPDGVFDFHGRSDAQVKIRGHRVEPGEVQAVLAADPRVARCAVVARRLPHGALALVGYVVAAPAALAAAGSSQTLHRELSRGLAARLPEAMVPAALVAVDDLPLTINSKLDVARLPMPTLEAGGGRRPRGPQEEAVCAVFSQVLGLESVGADDNFFALGGHSLVAMRAVTLIAERLGRRVGVAALLAAPTPAGLVVGLDGDHDPFAVVLPLGGHPGRGRAPVFCVHPMLGLGWTFSAIAARLDGSLGRATRGDRGAPAVYALQSPALRDPDSDPASLDALADDLIDAALAAAAGAGDDVAQTGCHVIGWSFGGHLAHVMTARLEARGIGVASLTLLDPGAPTPTDELEVPTGDGVEAQADAAGFQPDETEETDGPDEDMQAVLAFLLAAGLRDIPDWLTPPYDVEEALDFLTDGTGAFAGLGADDLEAFRRVRALNGRLLLRARYTPVDAPTVLVTSTATDPRDPSADGPAADPAAAARAWRELSRAGFAEHLLDVPHDLLTSPYAAERIAPLVPVDTGATRFDR
ncbi:amino acid adenylation domain-containing protein [Kineosphaera limosa]|uniref:Putative non-ribosomal peptide synthetase n=1 Tax=Kineosphaera limosa NBRC 100340 TaxID=1184609 RepID=K6X802_9MICO|nr:non-ribosomal peptide synthetase [Kineosphaera limosa]NYE00871.1 amino acid adenylation domain-containing protein [Kineosphaera limosa]GAB94934.1 putative non-ribosomal peptide synthetase [Kineosphaera limosa NBRC 100340]